MRLIDQDLTDGNNSFNVGVNLLFSNSVIVCMRISGSGEWSNRVWHLNWMLFALSRSFDRCENAGILERYTGMENTGPTTWVSLFVCNCSCKLSGKVWKWILKHDFIVDDHRDERVTLKNCSITTAVSVWLVLIVAEPWKNQWKD